MKKYRTDSKTVRIFGKTKATERGLELVTPGSFIEFTGEFSEINMEVYGSAEEGFCAYLGIFVNGNPTPEKVCKIQNGVKHYPLFSQSGKKRVKIKILKLTELQYGKAEILSVCTDGVPVPTETAGHTGKKMLFIGDSITAGYGVNGKETDLVFTTETEDVTKAYPYLTAEAFGAEAWFACFSGGGMISRWIPPEEEKPLTDILLPEVFDKSIDAVYIPDIVCLNIGTNDASYTRGDAQKEAVFAEAYMEFVKKLIMYYPNAYILIQYGLMEESLVDTIQNVAEQCAGLGSRCSFLRLPMLDKADGCGTGAHPSSITHKKTAQTVIREITAIMGWEEN